MANIYELMARYEQLSQRAMQQESLSSIVPNVQSQTEPTLTPAATVSVVTPTTSSFQLPSTYETAASTPAAASVSSVTPAAASQDRSLEIGGFLGQSAWEQYAPTAITGSVGSGGLSGPAMSPSSNFWYH